MRYFLLCILLSVYIYGISFHIYAIEKEPSKTPTLYEKILIKRIITSMQSQQKSGDFTIVLSEADRIYMNRIDTDRQTFLINTIETIWSKMYPTASIPIVVSQKEEVQSGVMRQDFGKYIAKNLEAEGKKIDYEKVQTTRMNWVNTLRAKHALEPYIYEPKLEYTAGVRNDVMIARNQRSHKRSLKDSFYAYTTIEQWFKNLGITFVNKKRMTFVENVGVPYFRCKEDECTDEVIAALQTTFDFYLSEAGTKHDAHYKSMINPEFRIGGLAFDAGTSQKQIYMTVHYATEIKEE